VEVARFFTERGQEGSKFYFAHLLVRQLPTLGAQEDKLATKQYLDVIKINV
jgi:hypothetical protein